jgi:hypothetical protein
MDPAALEYERMPRRPPWLEASPGRARLVMPPPPRWLVVGSVSFIALMWTACLMLLVMTLLVWRRAAAPPRLTEWTLLVTAGCLVLGAILFAGGVWMVRWSREPFWIEVADGILSYNWPGPLMNLRVHRVPLSKVRQVTARERFSVMLGKVVDLRIRRRGLAGTIRRVFRSPHAGFAADVEAAFERAISPFPAG